MKVTLSFHGSLVKYNQGRDEVDLEILENTTIEEAISNIESPRDEIAFVALNGSKEPLTTLLKGGDQIRLFQIVAGG